MWDYIKFWLARELVQLIPVVIFVLIGIIYVFWPRRLKNYKK